MLIVSKNIKLSIGIPIKIKKVPVQPIEIFLTYCPFGRRRIVTSGRPGHEKAAVVIGSPITPVLRQQAYTGETLR
jgi:hypothetical protein